MGAPGLLTGSQAPQRGGHLAISQLQSLEWERDGMEVKWQGAMSSCLLQGPTLYSQMLPGAPAQAYIPELQSSDPTHWEWLGEACSTFLRGSRGGLVCIPGVLVDGFFIRFIYLTHILHNAHPPGLPVHLLRAEMVSCYLSIFKTFCLQLVLSSGTVHSSCQFPVLKGYPCKQIHKCVLKLFFFTLQVLYIFLE